MATASRLLSEDQFRCCICLDVFTDPVAIPCGHNFCKTCITRHWDINVQCQCPMCNKRFDRRPELHVNIFISEMAAQFRQEITSSSSEQQRAKPGEVLCDICTETKEKALQSCLVCLASYCETHLEPHQRITGLKRHKLIHPVENLEGRMCKKHDTPLELFCKTDRVCVCRFCIESSHKRHHVVPLRDECDEKKAELGQTEAKVQQMIQERRLKIQELKQSEELSEEGADREIAVCVQVFANMIQSAEEGLAQLLDVIDGKRRTTENQCKGFTKELEMEITELMMKSCELEQLSRTEDHLRLLQGVLSLNLALPTKDWTEVTVQSSYEGTVKKGVAKLEETLQKEMKKLQKAELKRVQKFAADSIQKQPILK